MQLASEEHGLHIWPSALLLADYIWKHKYQFREQAVIELGAGVGLAGIVAALVGARVTLTDREDDESVLDNLRTNCTANGLTCPVLGLTWGQISRESESLFRG